ncbi:zinc ribbon domain-containing protein [Arthrobacter pigmenti]
MHATSPALRSAAAWLLGLTVVIAAAILTIFLVNTNIYGPQKQVKEYLQALRDGDGGKALGLLRAGVPDGANPALLDGKGLKATMDDIEDVNIGDPKSSDEEHVTVPVEYTVDGNTLTTSYKLEKVDTVWLFFDEWAFVPSVLPTISASVVNGNHATINSEKVGLPDGEATFAVFYPGEYTASYKTKYFEAKPTEVTVSTRQDSSSSQLALAAKPTEKLVNDVSTRIRQYLNKCATQDVFYPDGCPFSHPGTPFLAPGAEINWKIAEYPKIKIDAFNDMWVLKPLTGTAVVTSKKIDTFSGATSPLRAEHDFRFTARLDVNSGSVSVNPVVD